MSPLAFEGSKTFGKEEERSQEWSREGDSSLKKKARRVASSEEDGRRLARGQRKERNRGETVWEPALRAQLEEAQRASCISIGGIEEETDQRPRRYEVKG